MALIPQKHDSEFVTAEYSVYIFHHSDTDGEGPADWEKKVTTKSKHRAIAKAKKLYETSEYQRVEVKEKLSDSRDGLAVATTTRVFRKHIWLPDYLKAAGLAFGITAGIVVLAVILSFVLKV